MTTLIPGVTTPGQARRWWEAAEHGARDTYLAVTNQAHRDLMTGGYYNPASYRAAERKAFIHYNELSKAAWEIYQATLTELAGTDTAEQTLFDGPATPPLALVTPPPAPAAPDGPAATERNG